MSFGSKLLSGWTVILALGASVLSCPSFAADGAGDGGGIGDGRVSSFYTYTDTLPSSPGRLLRMEPLPDALGLPSAARQARILYSSTDGVAGSGIVAVSGALFLPQGQPPAGGWPLVAWAHGTVGLADVCAPSWAGRSYRDLTYLDAWLEAGYAIVSTDYQGLGTPGTHPYIQVRPEAYSVLDSIRAVLGTRLPLSGKVVVIGQSQGGGAAFATAAYAPTYAPDVQLLGVVATGVPFLAAQGVPSPDPNAVDKTIAYTYYVALSILGSGSTEVLGQYLTPAGVQMAQQARIECVAQAESDVETAGITRATALKPQLGALLGSVAPRFIYPTLSLRVPIFIGTGALDVDVNPIQQRQLAQDACKAGTKVTFRSYPNQDHSGAFTRSLQDALPFVQRLFNRQRVYDTCASLGQ